MISERGVTPLLDHTWAMGIQTIQIKRQITIKIWLATTTI